MPTTKGEGFGGRRNITIEWCPKESIIKPNYDKLFKIVTRSNKFDGVNFLFVPTGLVGFSDYPKINEFIIAISGCDKPMRIIAPNITEVKNYLSGDGYVYRPITVIDVKNETLYFYSDTVENGWQWQSFNTISHFISAANRVKDVIEDYNKEINSFNENISNLGKTLCPADSINS